MKTPGYLFSILTGKPYSLEKKKPKPHYSERERDRQNQVLTDWILQNLARKENESKR
jgi:hypothetical protein